ncbi:copper resistance CopC family protein [Microbacterium oleivorans]|uniref:copper resistance CopC family protein n=1 Tax=Microbacterium oleivorans TaxID=273677 RepID=UPI00203B2238|nr:copper resistance CopC family protein [Microbacterium oleivorans]MCM3696209.1 copper resistance protein CopC [Microbacterium oleivorans]
MRVLSSVPAALRAALAGVLLALAAVLTVANPAAAHDELVGSSPAVGADLAEAPAEITLTYSAAIMTEGATVAVFDASGRDWAEGAPAIDTNTLTLPVAGLPAAGYVVEWRVVSSDGHPISGTIPFTVGGGAPITSDDVAGAATPEDEGAVVPVVVGAVIAVAVIGITLWIVLSRRRSGAAER